MSKKNKKRNQYKEYMQKPGVRERRLEYYKQYYLANIEKRKAYFRAYYKSKKAQKEVSHESTNNM